jgi:hypothetical protein
LPPVVSPDTEVQIDAITLPFDFVDLALAVLLTARLERQYLSVPGEVLQPSQHLSNGHSARVATVAEDPAGWTLPPARCARHRKNVRD